MANFNEQSKLFDVVYVGTKIEESFGYGNNQSAAWRLSVLKRDFFDKFPEVVTVEDYLKLPMGSSCTNHEAHRIEGITRALMFGLWKFGE